MRQAYLANTDRTSIRVRLSEHRAYLNLKSTDSLIVREEFEYEIPPADARHMLSTLCDPQQIVKTRHYVRYADALWMIDEFHELNKGLVVAEIELRNPTENIEKPAWLGPEITEFSRYYNQFLAKRPYSTWTEAEREVVT